MIFDEAKKYIPGGVNSPVRSFNSVGGSPFFTKSAKGCHLYDNENKEYIDYVCSWGANIVGHANEYVVSKVIDAIHGGFSYGTPTELEIQFAKTITELIPSIEKLRLVSSGTEAVMSAIRLARGFTNKKYIIKFNGCYHGHSDSLLVKAGSGLATLNNPSSSGVLPEFTANTLVLEYNSIEDLHNAYDKYGNDIACIILEPFAGNMNLVRPQREFLAKIQQVCIDFNSLLIFDEVMTGFRVDLGCAQGLLGITPDLTTFGKVIGGGMPLAAFGGRAEIMDYLAPIGTVYQAGTLSGNPIAVTAGLANLEIIQSANFYNHLDKISAKLCNGLTDIAKHYSVPFSSDRICGMFGFYFSETIPTNIIEAGNADIEMFKKFFHMMLDRGVFFAPSMYEAGFICQSHNDKIIDETLTKADDVFKQLSLGV